MKNIINSIKTIAIIIATFVSINTFAYDFQVNGIYYKITSDSTVSVTYGGSGGYDSGNFYSGNIIIPSTVLYNSVTYTVTEIANNAFYKQNVDTVELANSITKIGEQAFESSSVSRVFFSNNLQSIGRDAFRQCESLDEVILPNSLTLLGDAAFSGCSSLKNTIIIPQGITKIESYVFSKCYSLSKIVLHDNITKIEQHAVAYTNIDSIFLPKNLTELSNAFVYNCSNLKYIKFKPTIIPDIYIDFNYNTLLNSLPDNITIEVPCGKSEEYKNANVHPFYDYYFFADLGEIVDTCIIQDITIEICDNQSYDFNDKDLTDAGLYTDTIDSDVINLTLIVYPTYDTVVVFDTIEINGVGTDYEDIVNIHTLQTIHGCDSVVTTKIFYKYSGSGLNDTYQSNEISIYPNPAHDKVTIEGKGEIKITNSLGQVVKEIEDNNTYRILNIKDFEKGVYYIKVGNTTQKLVVE